MCMYETQSFTMYVCVFVSINKMSVMLLLSEQRCLYQFSKTVGQTIHAVKPSNTLSANNEIHQ